MRTVCGELRRKSDVVRCAFCDRIISDSSMPDERTMALWSQGACRFCAARYELDGEARRLL
jgi:hypothetical protein